MKITVLYNIAASDDPSDTDTEVSAKLVGETLKNNGYQIELLGITPNQFEDKIKIIKTDCVFNLIEWIGKDLNLALKAIDHLEKIDVPYSGSRAWGYRLSSDKILMKQEMQKYNIPTPSWMITNDSKFQIPNFKFPLIAKPVYEHCGIGVSQKSIVNNEADLQNRINELKNKYHQPVLIEEYIAGREVHVTVLEKKGQPWVLPPAEVVFEKRANFWPILTYETKWQENSWEYPLSKMVLAEISPGLKKRLEKICIDCYNYLGGRSYPRIDIRIKNDEIFVLEINNNPGIDFDPLSGLAVSAKAAGLDFIGLLKNIIQEAYDTHSH